MKRFSRLMTLAVIILASCIGTDLEDPLNEEIAIVLPQDAVFRVNWGITLDAVFRADNGQETDGVNFQFSSSDPGVLEIVDGIGFGRSVGTAVISATAVGDGVNNDIVGELQVEILESREEITIVQFSDELGIGQSFVFGVNYVDPSGEAATTPISWESTNPSVATVSVTGQVTGVSAGTAEIIVTAGFGEDRVSLTVLEDEVVFDPEVIITTFKTIFAEGATSEFAANFTDETGAVVPDAVITWSSSNESVATVNADGLVTAITPGTANITASSGTVSDFIRITVEGQDVMRRSGTLRGIRGYRYSGSFSLVVNGDGDLILTFENVSLDTRAPGPYWYLTNSESSISGGLNLGPSEGGSTEINISDISPDTDLNTFQNFIIWCEPFNIQLGVGDFEE